jgi:peptidoglycan/xylan/chitin deacetylase (PgdA/CDA1 family)
LLLLVYLLLVGVLHVNCGVSLWWILPGVLVQLTLTCIGATYIQWNYFLTSHNHTKNKHQVALTFDDGPAQQTAAILDILKAEKVPAAFFIIGKNAAQHPEMVQRCHAEGHLVGNHSYGHSFYFDWKSTQAMQKEIAQTNELIRKIIGKKPCLFRPPYGVTNPNLARAIRRSGMYSIGWRIRSLDTVAKAPARLLHRIVKRLKGGDIILLHDSQTITQEVLTELIKHTREKGFTFVGLDTLLAIPPYDS